ncbi:anaphase promoting complex subunit doc1 [Tulasnella sp. JGI-2019a]|nr:anaphase promoting complex subunit doc1 [Tulasnella sp. JGI-2019a]
MTAVVHISSQGPQHLKSQLPDIGNLANWTVSSCKYGFNVSCLRDNDPNTYWQSDGPQPHYVTLQFQKKIAVQRLAIYLNFDADDSYTPTKLLIRAGTGLHDLQDIKSVSMEQPRGWIQFDVGSEPEGGDDSERMKPLFMYVLQVVIAANHQNGKDTHVRGLAVLGPKELPYSDEERIPFKSVLFKMHEFVR